jgi:hypothetical protein
VEAKQASSIIYRVASLTEKGEHHSIYAQRNAKACQPRKA